MGRVGLKQPRVQDRQDAADDALGGQGRLLRARLRLLACLLPAFGGAHEGTSLVHQGDHLSEHAPAALQGPGSRPERSNDQQPAHVALDVEEREQPGERRPDPRVPPRPRIVAVEHVSAGAPDPVVEGGEEARFAVGEQLVERAARDSRARDDVRDRDVCPTSLGHLLDHRREHPRALDLGHLPST